MRQHEFRPPLQRLNPRPLALARHFRTRAKQILQATRKPISRLRQHPRNPQCLDPAILPLPDQFQLACVEPCQDLRP